MTSRPFYHVAQFNSPSPGILARRAVIAAEMARVAKASEASLPVDERRQVIDLREGMRAVRDMALACAICTPIAFVWVGYMMVPG